MCQIREMEREIKEERGKARRQEVQFESVRVEATAQSKLREQERARLEEDKSAIERNLKAVEEELSNVKDRYKQLEDKIYQTSGLRLGNLKPTSSQ